MCLAWLAMCFLPGWLDLPHRPRPWKSDTPSFLWFGLAAATTGSADHAAVLVAVPADAGPGVISIDGLGSLNGLGRNGLAVGVAVGVAVGAGVGASVDHGGAAGVVNDEVG